MGAVRVRLSLWEEVALMARRTEKLISIRDAFFWIGVGFATAAFCMVGASNTELGNRLEHQTVPLSWVLAGIAILALLVAERCNSAATPSPTESAKEPVESESVNEQTLAAEAGQGNVPAGLS
jgi:hypothetical protein